MIACCHFSNKSLLFSDGYRTDSHRPHMLLTTNQDQCCQVDPFLIPWIGDVSEENLMCRTGNMAQQVQMLGAKSKDLSPIPGTQLMEEEN